MQPAALDIDQQALEAICQRYSVSRLALFGSALRSDFTPESDIDLLVEFIGGRTPGLYIVDMIEELEALFGRKVDLVTPRGLSGYFREQVLRDARVLYDAA